MRDCERNTINRPRALQQWRAVMRQTHNTTRGIVDYLGRNVTTCNAANHLEGLQ
jgi:hypothetical protein